MIYDKREAAAEAFRNHVGLIDLITAEGVMPRMDGLRACRVVRELNPGARVLFSMGDNEDRRTRKLMHAGARGLIRKLDDPAVLLHAVRRALAREGTPPSTSQPQSSTYAHAAAGLGVR